MSSKNVELNARNELAIKCILLCVNDVQFNKKKNLNHVLCFFFAVEDTKKNSINNNESMLDYNHFHFHCTQRFLFQRICEKNVYS